MSFSRENEIRRNKSVQRRKLDDARIQRQQQQTRNAISIMRQTANIFAIKEQESYNSIGLVMQVAQQRALSAASGLGQSINRLA